MTLAHAIIKADEVRHTLLTAAQNGNPALCGNRLEEAAALSHLISIARQHLRPEPSPAIAEAMVAAMETPAEHAREKMTKIIVKEWKS